MDTHPNSVPFASLAVGFLSSAASDDAPAIAPTADKTFEFSSETTQMSKTTGVGTGPAATGPVILSKNKNKFVLLS